MRSAEYIKKEFVEEFNQIDLQLKRCLLEGDFINSEVYRARKTAIDFCHLTVFGERIINHG